MKSTSILLSKGIWILVSMILASSMGVIDATALNVALPSLQKALNASGSQLLWVVNAYALMLAALILVGGSLGDIFGRKKIMLVGISVFVFSSLVCGLSPTIEMLISARVFQGIGAAVMIPGSLAIIAAEFDDHERGRAIGMWSSAGAIMVVFGPVLGGLLTDIGLWRAIFYINFPIGVSAFLIIFFKVPESRNTSLIGKQIHIDLLGAVLISIGLGLLTYGFTEWSQSGFSIEVKITVLLGVILLLGFLYNEYKNKLPMMPLGLFKSAVFSGANLLTFFLYGALTVSVFFLSINLIQVQGYSSSKAGLAFLAFPAPIFLLSSYAGSLSDKFGSKWLLVAGPVIAGASFIYLSQIGLTKGPSAYWTTFFPGLLLFGLGMAITVVPLTNTVMGSVERDLSGTASGINNAVTRIASVLALALLGSLAIVLLEVNMNTETKDMHLSYEIHQTFKSESRKLAGAEVSNKISPELKPAVQHAFKLAFTDTYSFIMKLCSVLAFFSALMTLGFIPNKKKIKDQ